MRWLCLPPTISSCLFCFLWLTVSLFNFKITISLKDSPYAKARTRTVSPSQYFVFISFFFLEFLAANLKVSMKSKTNLEKNICITKQNHHSTTPFLIFMKAFTGNGPFTAPFFRTVQFSRSVMSNSLWHMNRSTPGLPVHHQLPEYTQLMSTESGMPPNHPVLCHSFLFLASIFPSIRGFPLSQIFTSGGQSIGVSALASVLPKNTQDWSPLGWTGWISLQFKGLSRGFSNHSSKASILPALSFLYSPILTSIHDHWENHSLD